ncbi:aromatic ring-hydroxylating oxygenase subunit alpha [Tsuneonella mangrovi]|uniref:aromatic ring-hydroxylating oxygenase subunit alpha n=1 Tax=Tsuneonella mangrovi TaxID=1982042 RepID=UPI001F0B0D70|nr:aromatic ring-hydroxylating dioxygenase subunit alpha [Tsuneonella mangrovi]
MTMPPEEIATLKALMEWEARRTAPPAGFPKLPDLPADRYTNEELYALEQEHVFRKSWLFAAHLDEIPDPGSFMRWHNAGDPIVIVHGMDGEVRAFYNTCRHRGAPVVTEDRGKSPRLICAYHHWTYKTDGSLVGVPERQDFADLDLTCRGLIPVRCEMFGKLVFVNFDDDALPLREWLGPLADEWAEFQFENVRLAARYSFDLNCNWKVAMEANMEVYHVPFIHPETVAPIVDAKRNVNHFYPNGHSRMLAPAPETADRQADRANSMPPEWQRIDTVGELGRTATQSYSVFPNWVSPLSDFFIPPLLFWPTGIGTTRLELITMAPDWGDGPVPDLWTEPDPASANGRKMCKIILEDTQFGEAIQKSMESQGFRSVPLSYQEARIYAFHQHCDRLVGEDNIPEGLAVEQVIDSDWVWPNDPRIEQMRTEASVAAE